AADAEKLARIRHRCLEAHLREGNAAPPGRRHLPRAFERRRAGFEELAHAAGKLRRTGPQVVHGVALDRADRRPPGVRESDQLQGVPRSMRKATTSSRERNRHCPSGPRTTTSSESPTTNV